jgi:CBS domain-containing protein
VGVQKHDARPVRARDFMVEPLVVYPEYPLRELVELLLREHAEGACVVEDDRLVGVVTAMDLVFQEKRVHLPSVLAVMDFVIPLEPPSTLRDELDKIAATTVRDLMSGHPRSVGPDTPLQEVATMMVEGHLTVVPVVEDGRLVGMIGKPALLRAVFPAASGT